MQIVENVPLSTHSTMRLGGLARYITEVTTRQEVQQAVAWAQAKDITFIMIGSGSNIVWQDQGYPGLVIVDKIMGFESQEENSNQIHITIGSGENWDEIVNRTVKMGFSGIECLSLIPGTAGATPVQNVGAYGQEIKNSLVSVEAFDTQTNKFVIIPASDCAFGYRTSRFKTTDKGRFLITSLIIALVKTNPKPPFYASLQNYLEDHNITSFTPQIIRDAVIAIRQSKLPDPSRVANNGSFFANPIINESEATQLRADHPGVVMWGMDDAHSKVKVSAAWLVEQAGFKDVHDSDTGMATWSKQPLVLVNEHAHKTADLIKFRDKIIASVKQKFGISLEQEPELI